MSARLFTSQDTDLDQFSASAEPEDKALWEGVKSGKCNLYLIEPTVEEKKPGSPSTHNAFGLSQERYKKDLPKRTFVVVQDIDTDIPPEKMFNTGEINELLQPPYVVAMTWRLETKMNWPKEMSFEASPVMVLIRTVERRHKAWERVLGLARGFAVIVP